MPTSRVSSCAHARPPRLPHHRFFGGFGGFGGGDSGEPETPKGRTVTVELQVTLRDLYLGRVFQVTRDKAVFRPAKGTRKCNCKTRMTTRQIAPGMYQQIPTQQCEQCPGMALGRESETIRVEVEKGSQDGTEISFFEQGEPLLDGEPGDLRFKLVTVDASGFVRTGNDLALDVSLTLAEALVGFTKTVQHLDGHAVELAREGVTSHGEVQRVRGQGMPHAHAHTKFGDLLVKYHIQVRVRRTSACAMRRRLTQSLIANRCRRPWTRSRRPLCERCSHGPSGCRCDEPSVSDARVRASVRYGNLNNTHNNV